MKIKLFELRDRATFIPIFAFEASKYSGTEEENYLLGRAGYGGSCIVVGRLDCYGKFCYEPGWNDRTFDIAHRYLEQNWHSLESGAVVDVEFILGETTEKKKSERTEDMIEERFAAVVGEVF